MKKLQEGDVFKKAANGIHWPGFVACAWVTPKSVCLLQCLPVSHRGAALCWMVFFLRAWEARPFGNGIKREIIC